MLGFYKSRAITWNTGAIYESRAGGSLAELLHFFQMNKLDTAQVAQTLHLLGQRIELEGGNPYRARAYSRAAENLGLSAVPLEKMIADGSLTQIPGVGDALAAVITEIYQTGDYSGLKAKKEKVPDSVLEM